MHTAETKANFICIHFTMCDTYNKIQGQTGQDLDKHIAKYK